MKQYLLGGIAGVFILLLGGCQNQHEQSNASMHSPHLMRTPSTVSAAFSSTHPIRINPALELRKMEMTHRERLAALEAKQAQALKRLELLNTQRIEELRKQNREIEAQKALELEREKQKYAAILAQKERDLKRMEANLSREHDQAQITLGKIEGQNRLSVEKIKGEYGERIKTLDTRLKERTLWVALIALGLILLFWFLLVRYRKTQEAKEREEQRRHEAWLLQRKQEQQRIEAILEIIASSETDKDLKLELTRLLQQDAEGKGPKLIEYKKPED